MSKNNIAPSELILNSDGSIYHLHLKPGELAKTILTVGDQNRVEAVSKHFDSIEIKRQHREFTTHTGYIGEKRLSVISTCLLYTSPSPRDGLLSRMPSSA